MKKIILHLYCLLAFYSLQTTTTPKGPIPLVSKKQSQQGKSIINNPTIPFTISTPGEYYLISDISVTANSSITLIAITSSNVTLNLYGKTLSQTLPSAHVVTGISIADDLSNITIENGTINGITGTGITVGQDCSHITIQNMHINQAAKGGISVDTGTSAACLYNCTVNKSISTGQDSKGISLTQNSNIHISHCSVVGTQAPSSYDAYGLYASSCHSCTIQNSIFNSAQGDDANGVYLSSCTNMTCDNNEMSKNYATVGDSHGIHFVTTTGSTISNCIASENKAETTSFGIKLETNSHYNKILNSTTSYQQVIDTGTAYGIEIDTSNSNHCIGVISCNNKGGSDVNAKALGIRSYQATGNVISNSICSFNDGNAGQGLGIIINNSVKCVIENNKTYYNSGSSNSYGIREYKSSGTSTSLIHSNISFGNANNYSLTFSDLNAVQSVTISAPRSVTTTTLGNVSITTS